jgi:uncharacterized protein (DUF1330 family)
MAAYVIADVKVSDPEQYARYMALSPGAIAAAGGRFIARGGRHETLEGHWQPNRLVIIEFPDYATAKTFYDSEKYRAARDARAGTTEFFNMVVTEGVPSA